MSKASLSLVLFSFSFSAMAGMSNFMAWGKKDINVCFAGKGTIIKVKNMPNGFANWKDQQKQYIADVLNREFLEERTGYRFVGFGDCEPEGKHDVVVVRKANYSPHALTVKGSATVGYGLLAPSPNYKSARAAVLFTASGIKNDSTIVHEFGHILGLKHEHLHPDAKAQAQSWCSHYTSKTDRYYYNMYTSFDEESVMNYCRMQWDSKVGLSQGDVEHIRALYNYSSIKDKREFH